MFSIIGKYLKLLKVYLQEQAPFNLHGHTNLACGRWWIGLSKGGGDRLSSERGRFPLPNRRCRCILDSWRSHVGV